MRLLLPCGLAGAWIRLDADGRGNASVWAAPALRASAVQPVSALKGGEDPHARRRLMHALVGLQTAFCFWYFSSPGCLWPPSSGSLINPRAFQPIVSSPSRPSPRARSPPDFWDQVAENLRALPDVEKAAAGRWPLLRGRSWNNFISVNGAPLNGVLAYILSVSPGWIETMRIPLLDGRDFRPNDTYPGVCSG